MKLQLVTGDMKSCEQCEFLSVSVGRLKSFNSLKFHSLSGQSVRSVRERMRITPSERWTNSTLIKLVDILPYISFSGINQAEEGGNSVPIDSIKK